MALKVFYLLFAARRIRIDLLF